jgi:putative membrane protein
MKIGGKDFSMDKEKTIDSKYIQQHLANERTFLAWVRTSITVVGLGFISAGLVFRTEKYQQFEQRLAAYVGISSVILGSVIMFMAVQNYFAKQVGINEETFRSPRFIITASFSCLALIDVLMIALILFISLR